ncbi:MAG: hypothetical protein IPL43_05730 [Micropruina sp.]|nr:hypothetical protein [Micropruina sp.]
MNIKQKTGLAIGGVVVAMGAALGIASMATADTAATTPSTVQVAPGTDTAAAPPAEGGRGGGQGMGARGPGGGHLAADLATELGVEEATVQAAVDEVFAANRPTDGSRPDRAAMDAQLATALATKLNIDQAKVTAALEAVHADQKAPASGSDPAASGTGTTIEG